MDRIDSLRAFVQVVDQGGFAAAARAMGLSRSVVNRAIISLEQRLGAALLRRSTRQVSPTDAGQVFYQQCLLVLEQYDEAIAAVTELQDTPRGSLRVNAPMSFGMSHLAPIAAAFMARYPQVHLELALSDRQVDPLEEGFDVTLRIGDESHATSLINKRLAPVRRLACASPAYLAQAGEPLDPAELIEHRCLHYGYLASGSQWPFARSDGRDQHVSIRCVMWSNNGEVLRAAAVAGQGIALLPTFIVGPFLQTGELRTVLQAFEPQPSVLMALYPRHRNLSTKVRLFVEFMAAQFGERPQWDLVD